MTLSGPYLPADRRSRTTDTARGPWSPSVCGDRFNDHVADATDRFDAETRVDVQTRAVRREYLELGRSAVPDGRDPVDGAKPDRPGPVGPPHVQMGPGDLDVGGRRPGAA